MSRFTRAHEVINPGIIGSRQATGMALHSSMNSTNTRCTGTVHNAHRQTSTSWLTINMKVNMPVAAAALVLRKA